MSVKTDLTLSNAPPRIEFSGGDRQSFRHRCDDLHVAGRVIGMVHPIQATEASLNDARPRAFVVLDGTLYRSDNPNKGPNASRLVDHGDFVIEWPIDSPDLRVGVNTLSLRVVGADGQVATGSVELIWDPTSVAWPIDLTVLEDQVTIQQIGQVVNGPWRIDRERRAIRCGEPVGPDRLLLLGSPGGSQEATYRVVFGDPATGRRGAFVGLSDFWVGHERDDPAHPLKPGWSSAGLATLQPKDNETGAGGLQAWMAWGDLTRHRPEKWVVKTNPPVPFKYLPGTPYRVRHRVRFDRSVNRTCFRIWLEHQPEPDHWHCAVSDAEVPRDNPRFTQASFGLFQFGNTPTLWSDIRVHRL